MISTSPSQTRDIAAELARTLHAGDCLALYGELGAGKTQFVRGLITGLGGNPRDVSSPTFVLLNIYRTPALPVFHLDAYRTHGPEDFESIGFSELLDQGGLVVVEWPQRIEALLPSRRICVTLRHLSPRRREITIER